MDTLSDDEVLLPLGLANPLLPPEPLGQEPLYPQFLMPVATVPLMAANPAVFFPEGLPGYQPPDNTFQESPFFIQAREALRPRPIEVLPEVSPRAPRPPRSELLNELAPPENFETFLEAPEIEAELTSPLIEELEAPNLENIPALEELAEVESNVISEAIEVEEPSAVQPAIDTPSLSPETTSTPISGPEENLISDPLLTEPITTNPIPEEAELLPAGELSAVLTEPEFPQVVETPEVLEPEITAELPALPIEAEEPVSQEAALTSEIPVSFIPTEEVGETTEVVTDVINPEPELLSGLQLETSTENSQLEEIALEAEETLQAPEPAVVQTVVAETEEPILESPAVENTELLESPVLPEIEVPEEVPLAASSSEGAEPLSELPEEPPIESEGPILATPEIENAELLESPVLLEIEVPEEIPPIAASSPEEAPPEVLETPIATSEIIPKEQKEIGIVSESSPLEEEAEGAVSTSEAATSLPVEITAEASQSAETAPPETYEEQLLITEEVPINIESEEPPVTPKVEPIAAEQNVPEETIASSVESLAARVQEMATPIVEQGLENEPETEASPLISRRQEFLEEQIEVSSGLEPEELGVKEAAFVPENVSPEVHQESSANPETEIAETPLLEIPGPVLVPTEASAAAPENPLVEEEQENLSVPNQPEMLRAPAVENLEVIPSLPTMLEDLGILTSLITASPLTQLSNFLPTSSEPFSSGRQMGMPFGLEQPMTFASPNVPRQTITRREEDSVAPTPTPEPSLLTTPNSPEPSEQNSPRENQSAENTQETVNAETTKTDGNITAEALVSPRQEALLQSLEEEIQLPIVNAPSVMRSNGNYIPLTFASKPTPRSRSTAQQERAPSFSTEENIPTEWSSIEELIRGNSSSRSEELISSLMNPESTNFDNWENLISYGSNRNYTSPEGNEEQGYSSTFMPLEQSNEETTETLKGNDEFSLENINEEEMDELELEVLARKIYSFLQQKLAIERERKGLYIGRLPW